MSRPETVNEHGRKQILVVTGSAYAQGLEPQAKVLVNRHIEFI